MADKVKLTASALQLLSNEMFATGETCVDGRRFGMPGGEFVWLPDDMVEPVVPPIPEEPGPGVYLLGELAIQRPEGIGGGHGFHWQVAGQAGWLSFEGLWKRWGGPGVQVRRLVPEPGPCQECVQPGGAVAPDDGPLLFPGEDVANRLANGGWIYAANSNSHRMPKWPGKPGFCGTSIRRGRLGPYDCSEGNSPHDWHVASDGRRALAVWPVKPQGAVAEQQPGRGAT